MTAAERAAAAVHAVLPAPNEFPAVGVLRRVTAQGQATAAFTARVSNLGVSVGGFIYQGQDVWWSGAFLAEVQAADPNTDFVGRDVVVDIPSGRLTVMTTINRSG